MGLFLSPTVQSDSISASQDLLGLFGLVKKPAQPKLSGIAGKLNYAGPLLQTTPSLSSDVLPVLKPWTIPENFAAGTVEQRLKDEFVIELKKFIIKLPSSKSVISSPSSGTVHKKKKQKM